MTFITDPFTLADKSDLRSIPTGADPTRYVNATDWNAVLAALADIRTSIIAILATPGGIFDTVLSPAQITGTTSDWNVGSLGYVTLVKYTSDAARTINSVAGGVDGKIICFLNENANTAWTLTFAEETGATAANRMRTAGGAGASGSSGGAVWFRYNGATSRWQQIATT